MAENDDERITRFFDFSIPRFDQFAADTMMLVFRKDCHGT